MSKAGVLLVIFILLFGGVPLGIYMWDMPYENWVFLENVGIKGIVILLIGIFCFWLFISGVSYSQPPTDSQTSQMPLKEEEFHLPEFAQVIHINKHTFQVSWKDKSFAIWKDKAGTAYYQELNIKNNQPIGKTFSCDDPRYLGKHIANEFKKI